MASPQISRRDFLALAGLTSASAGCPAMAQALKAKDPDAGLKTFQATCSMECLHCNLKAFVKDGKVVKSAMRTLSTANPAPEVCPVLNGFTLRIAFFTR